MDERLPDQESSEPTAAGVAGLPLGPPNRPLDEQEVPATEPPAPVVTGLEQRQEVSATAAGPKVVDLEQGQGQKATPAAPPPVSLPSYPDKIRGRIAMALIALVAAVVAASFLTIWAGTVFPGIKYANLKDLLTIVFGPLIALAAAAVGYYFGGKPGSPGS